MLLTPQRNEAVYASSCDERLRSMWAEVFEPRLRPSLQEWAESHRRWPDGSPYETATTPHVREIMAAYSDPAIEEITIVKPTQSGLTEGFALNAIGYHADVDPRDVMIVIPSVDEAEKWSKKKLQPMIDSTPRLRDRLEDGSRKSSNTILEKSFAGGSVGIVGSNSGRGFRMVTIGVAIGDDIEAWDATAGKGAKSEGDQVTLIRRRTDRVPDRKLAWISTPLLVGGRLWTLYHEMESRGQWHVPCPHCGAMQVLRWGGPDAPFGIKWDQASVAEGYEAKPGEVVHGRTVHRPDTAYYLCEASGCVIEESSKPAMEELGEYLDDEGQPVRRPGVRTVGYWLRGALTLTLPGAEWPRLVREFLGVKDNPEKRRTFFNTVLAEFHQDRGESPEWKRLYERRERYEVGTCPDGVVFLTAGVDVQKDRLEAFVWGWGYDKESWFLEHGIFPGDPYNKATWSPLTELLHRSFPRAEGAALPLAALAIDTGYADTAVVDWARRVGDPRVMLVKGDHWKNWKVIVGVPSKQEVTLDGRKVGYFLWPVGGALIKQETYGFLALDAPVDGEPYPPGYVHLPMIDDELVQQFVAEDLMTVPNKRGFPVREWVKTRHRNEFLDGRVYARAAAEREGLSRLIRGDEPMTPQERPKRKDGESRSGGGWLERGSAGRARRGGWLR